MVYFFVVVDLKDIDFDFENLMNYLLFDFELCLNLPYFLEHFVFFINFS